MKSLVTFSATATLSLALCHNINAEIPKTETTEIEEVLVSAQLRLESLEKTPLSIAVVSNDQIQQSGADTITDIIPMIAGLNGTTYGLITNIWSVRGISSNDWSTGSEPSVGVYLDGTYIGRNVLATGAFFDIDRIEVIKGPQGTLFGRNTAAGAIRMISNKPADETRAQLGFGAGNEGQQYYQALGNMVLSEQLALRAAYYGSRLEGIWENSPFDENAFTDTDSLRLMAEWRPSKTLTGLLTLSVSEAASNMPGSYSPSLSTVEPGRNKNHSHGWESKKEFCEFPE